MFYRLLLPLLLLALTASTADAQQRPGQRALPPIGSLSGQVLDAETNDPVASATVAVWRAADSTLTTGAITNVDGTFTIEGLRPGRLYVKVSFVGYAPQTISDLQITREERALDLGTIALASDTQQLDEVEVAAEREQVQIQIDRTVYNTADDPVAAGGTATNVLETIPSVNVDIDGNISLRGSGNVAILINGRPAPVSAQFLPAFLRQLPADAIERVEVIPNPSAKYDPEGMGGIINIVLKDDADTGLGGTITAGVDTQGGYSGTGMLSYGNGPLTLTGSYGFRQEEDIGGGESFRINRYADPLTFLDQNEDEDESGTSHNATLSADYALSSKTTLTSSVQFGLQDEIENELNTYLELDAAQAPTLNYQRQVEEDDDRWNADVRVGLQHDFGTPSARSGARPGASMGRRGRWGRRGSGRSSGGAGLGSHSLSAEARYNTFVNDGLETYTEQVIGTGELRELQQAQTDREREEASLTVDYVRPLGGMRLESGYKGELERLHSDFFSQTLDQTTDAFAPDVDLNNVFDFDQQIHAVYGQLAREWGPLGVQAGLRFEFAQTTFTLQNTDESFDNDYTSLFPSAFFTYTLNEANTLKASYSRRVNRPRTWFLNPFPSYDDPLNLRVGNPFLEPEYIDAIEAGYVRFTSWGSLTLTPYYRRTTNVIRRYQEIRDDGVTVRTVENFDTRDAFGLELISSFQGKGVLDGLRGFASLEGYQVNTDGSSVDADLQNNAFGWGGRLNMTYQLGSQLGWGGLDLQGNVFYRAPRDTEQGRIGSFTFFNLALRQQFMNDRANLTLRVRDPFDLAGFSYELDQPTLYQELERDWGAQQVGLTFSYSFGQQDRQRNQNRDRGDRGGGDFDDMEM